jgi:hypothetical protein
MSLLIFETVDMRPWRQKGVQRMRLRGLEHMSKVIWTGNAQCSSDTEMLYKYPQMAHLPTKTLSGIIDLFTCITTWGSKSVHGG